MLSNKLLMGSQSVLLLVLSWILSLVTDGHLTLPVFVKIFQLQSHTICQLQLFISKNFSSTNCHMIFNISFFRPILFVKFICFSSLLTMRDVLNINWFGAFLALVFHVLNSSWALALFVSLSGNLGSLTSSDVSFLSSKKSFSCRHIGRGRRFNSFKYS